MKFTKRTLAALPIAAIIATASIAISSATADSHKKSEHSHNHDASSHEHAHSDGFVNIFNGKDFTGWDQRGGKAKYHVEDGQIVGTTVRGTPNSFVTTEKHYSDFILELDFKVDPKLNSGVQIRSNSNPSHLSGRVHGYQVEIDPSKRSWSAGIYEEGRRGWLFKLDKNKPAREAFKQNDWNHYKVIAKGNNIKTYINGVLASDLTDKNPIGYKSGFIGLQVHSHSKAGLEVRWKNIKIKELK